MSKLSARTLVLLLTLALPGVAKAGSYGLLPGYLGVNFSYYEQEPEKIFSGLNGGKSFETNDVHLRLGGRISNYFASELRLGGLRDEWTQGNHRYRYDYHLSAHLRANYPLGFLVPYVQLGYSVGQRSVTFPDEDLDLDWRGQETLASYSYGAGIDLLLGNRLGVNLEYAHPYPQESTAPTMVSGGLFFRF